MDGWINLRLNNNSDVPLVYVAYHSISGNNDELFGQGSRIMKTKTIEKKTQGIIKMEKRAMVAIIHGNTWLALYKPDPGLYDGERVDLSTSRQ